MPIPLLHAFRSLRRSPGFSLTALLTLVLGITAVGAMFAVVHGVLLAPLPYAEPERLVSVELRTADGDWLGQPLALEATYRGLARSFDGFGFYRSGSVNISSDGDASFADSVIGTWITESTLPMLRAAPLLGRNFTAEETLRGGPQAAILSEAEWRSRYHAAADVIGKTVLVNSVRRQIVGVMPAGFTFPLQNAETRVWLPAKREQGAVVDAFAYTGVARLRAGVDIATAQHELAALLPRVAETFPRLTTGASTASWLAETQPMPELEPLRERLTGSVAGLLWLLAGAAGLVLLVAWANVGNLLLIRADARRADVAVRAALGAGRLRRLGQSIAEALWLAAVAGLLAWPLAAGAVAMLAAFSPAEFPRLLELHVGGASLMFIGAVTALSIGLCAAVPALASWQPGLTSGLHAGGRRTSAGIARLRMRGVITIVQIAVALVVTISAVLLARSAGHLADVQPGFEAEHVLVVRTQLPYGRYGEADALAFYMRLVDRVRQLPGVERAGLGRQVPLASNWLVPEVTLTSDGEHRARALPMMIVDEGYFDTLAIPLLAGRGPDPTTPVRDDDIVISRLAAQALFDDPTGSAAIGRRLSLTAAGPHYTVVGVVGDVRDQDLQRPLIPMAYRPPAVTLDPSVEPEMPRNLALFVRAKRPTDALVEAIRQVVRALDPAVPIYAAEPLRDVVRASTARLSLALVLIGAAAVTTLVLGVIGLYGVMAYMVALRRHEFGIRIALGAGAAGITRLVAARGLRLTGIGLVIGLIAYLFVAPLLRGWLFEVTMFDPATLAAAIVLLGVGAAWASWWPARQAAGVEPAQALRAE